MKDYRIISMNPEKGIAIVTDESGKFSAMVNGKLYRVDDYRPMDGNGRQLRGDSIEAIKRMMVEAPAAYEAQETRRRDAFAAAVAEAQKAAAPAPLSFADKLEAAFMQTLTEKTAGEMVETIFPVVEKKLVDKFGILPKVHEIHVNNSAPVTIKGVLHKDFDTVVAMTLDHEPAYLSGPAGTGKSYMAKQLAEALNLPYWFTGCVLDEVQLKGFIDANGKYHETQFYKAFTTGGIFFLDELDASHESTLILINDCLSNGYFDFPNGRAEAHPDFHPIAAGNTYGTGADMEYVGRSQLDASTLDRFCLIPIDYDPEIEAALSNGDAELVAFAQDFRKAVKAAGTSCLCTYRAIKRLAKMTAYADKSTAIRIGLTKGLPADDIRAIYDRMTVANSWREAMRTLF